MALSAMTIRQNPPEPSLRGTLAARLTCYDAGLQPEPTRTRPVTRVSMCTNDAECVSQTHTDDRGAISSPSQSSSKRNVVVPPGRAAWINHVHLTTKLGMLESGGLMV